MMLSPLCSMSNEILPRFSKSYQEMSILLELEADGLIATLELDGIGGLDLKLPWLHLIIRVYSSEI